MTDRTPPITERSATRLAQQIRDGELSAVDAVRAHVDRARRVNPTLNAIVAERYEQALAEAHAADARARAGGPLPALHGVPCTLKESFELAGSPWTSGLRARADLRGERDAVTVRRLREAGAIVIGTTNLSELCMWMESDNPVYGRTNNPYDPTRTCGGSSGGEGAIVGSGASPFGLGADVGGSIRIPAFFNGVFGHKPSVGLVPNAGQHPLTSGSQHMLATGPIARRAEDLYPLLRILAGPDGSEHVTDQVLGDPHTVAIEGLPVLNVPDNELFAVHPDLRHAQDLAARHLQARGARTRLARFPDLRYSFDIWSAMISAQEGPRAFLHLLHHQRRRDLLPHLLRRDQYSLPAVVLGLVEDATLWLPQLQGRALERGELLRASMWHAMGDGVLLFPSYPSPAPRHGHPLRQVIAWTYTSIFNALGFPVTQVPLGLSAEGLPLGVQVVARPGNDHVTIAVALELERGFGGWVPPERAPRGVRG